MTRRHKYNAERTDGYDSKAERDVALFLKEAESQGHIKDLQEQVPFALSAHKRLVKTYRPDFVFVAGGYRYVVDVKGIRTEAYGLTVRLFLAEYSSGYRFVEVVKGQPWHLTMPKRSLRRTPVTWAEVFEGRV